MNRHLNNKEQECKTGHDKRSPGEWGRVNEEGKGGCG
jgi:hypothetical protein